MKAYKGFNENLTCTPNDKIKFQYEVGKTYEEPIATLCEKGFHACENPLDVFGYYAPAKSRFCEIKLGDVTEQNSSDTKRVGKRIEIVAEIGLPGIIKAGVVYILDRVDWSNSKKTNTGNHSASTNTGDHSASTNTGDNSAATNTGNKSASTNTGYYSASTNTGNYSASTTEGKNSIAFAMGIESKARGSLGCWIVLAEWHTDENLEMNIKTVKTARVDGEKIKADTFYILKNRKFIEV